MKRTVTFKGTPLTLVGRRLAENTAAPSFKVVSGDMQEVTLSSSAGSIRLLSVFPSLDTPVCDLQVKEFTKRAATLDKTVRVIHISKDLPFAQQRFCQANAIENAQTLSDYRLSSFGLHYGLLIKELNLLARAVMIIDSADIIRYIQIAPELTQPLDYNAALKKLELVLKSGPSTIGKTTVPEKCMACEGNIPALSSSILKELASQLPGWRCIENRKLIKEFTFPDFIEAKYFIDLLSLIAEEQKHHPSLTIDYTKVTVGLTTHAIKGLSQNDFIMAKIIDSLGVTG